MFRRTRHHSRHPSRGASRGFPIIAGLLLVLGVAAAVPLVLAGPGATPTIRPTATTTTSPGLPAVDATSTLVPVGVPTASQFASAPSTPVPTQASTAAAERITIERLGIDVPIVEGDGIDAPLNKVAHFPGTAQPGDGSNIYLYGHGIPQVFRPLWDARIGDVVELGLVDGTTRAYVVDEIRPTVPWDAIELLDPTPTEQLTLQTCNPNSTPSTPRFVVIAHLTGDPGG